MAQDNPRQALRDLYADGLRECGFDQAAVERGLAMLESDRYSGFSDVVVSLQISGFSHIGAREHTVETVIQRVATQEGQAAIALNGARAAGRVAARRAQEAEDREDSLRRAQVRVQELEALLREMTSDELDGRTPLRPHIAEAFRATVGQPPPTRSASRPSWVGRAPGPKTVREVEPPAGVVESFRSLGLSEEAAEIAVKGR